MRKLAAELGVGPVTLCSRVPDPLDGLIVDAVLDAVDFSGDEATLDAQERAIRLARALRSALLAHPSTVPIPLRRSAAGGRERCRAVR